MARPVRIAAVVVTYNHEHEIEACVDAALAQASPGLDVQVVVVDNASSDATLDRLARYGDAVTVIANDTNTGFAAGVNTGVETAGDRDAVLLLNPDVVMDGGCLQVLHDHLERHARCAGAAAFLRWPDGSLQTFARRAPTFTETAWTSTYVGRRVDERLGGRADRKRRYAREWARGFDGPFEVDCPAAACVLVRRELLEPHAMSPELPLFYNDTDLWRRLRRAGGILDVVPAATAEHGGGTSIRRSDAVLMRAEWVAATRTYMRGELGRLGRPLLDAILFADAVAIWLLHRVRLAPREAYSSAVGTLGGLGLPGGPPPPLTPVRRLVRRGRAGSRRSP
jgi:GT2 family glycosyltransferase